MQATVETSALIRALASIKPSVRKFNGIHIHNDGDGTLTIAGVNPALTVSAKLAARGEPGQAHVNINDVQGLLQGHKGAEVTLDVREGALEPTTIYEKPPVTTRGKNKVVLPVDMLAAVATGFSKDSDKEILQSVFFDPDENAMVATDSYKLFKVTSSRDLKFPEVAWPDGRDASPLLVPGHVIVAVLAEVKRQRRVRHEPTVVMSWTASKRNKPRVTFTVGDVAIASNLREGQFPNYRWLIPSSYPCTFTFDPIEASAAVKKIPTAGERCPTVHFLVDPDKDICELRCWTYDKKGESSTEHTGSFPAAFEGEAVHFALNPFFFLQMIDQSQYVGSCSNLTVGIIDAQRPQLTTYETTCGDGTVLSHQRLLMPIRIS